MNTKKMDLPIVCDLSVFTADERKHHEATSMDVTRKAKRIIELEDGFAFHHNYSETRFVDFAKWMTRENRCCPFFTFELVIEPFASGREIIVRLKGSPEAKQTLKGGFEKLKIQTKD